MEYLLPLRYIRKSALFALCSQLQILDNSYAASAWTVFFLNGFSLKLSRRDFDKPAGIVQTYTNNLGIDQQSKGF